MPFDGLQESPAKIGAVMIRNNSSGIIVLVTSATWALLSNDKKRTQYSPLASANVKDLWSGPTLQTSQSSEPVLAAHAT